MPYYTIRDYPGVLDTHFVYVRRGETIGVLRPPEIEALIRHKNAQGSTPVQNAVISVGFVEPGGNSSNPKIIARIVNLTDEPISDVSTIWDIRLPAWPSVFSRSRSYNSLQLGPGEAIEDEVDLTDQFFLGTNEKVNVRDRIHAGSRWFDIVLRVQFRDRDGFLQQLERTLSTSN
jgi:hypothetical protein